VNECKAGESGRAVLGAKYMKIMIVKIKQIVRIMIVKIKQIVKNQSMYSV